jgi:hypothetical protein
LQSTRSEAIARNASFLIDYDLEGHRYRVVTPFKADGGLAPTPAERAQLAWHDLPRSVRFKSITIDEQPYDKGSVFVQFDALGSASGHLIVLEQPELGNQYTIEVQGLLGLIDYREGLYQRQKPNEDEFR